MEGHVCRASLCSCLDTHKVEVRRPPGPRGDRAVPGNELGVRSLVVSKTGERGHVPNKGGCAKGEAFVTVLINWVTFASSLSADIQKIGPIHGFSFDHTHPGLE